MTHVVRNPWFLGSETHVDLCHGICRTCPSRAFVIVCLLSLSSHSLRTIDFPSSSSILAQRGKRRDISVNEEFFASIVFPLRSGSLNEDDNGRDEE